MILVLALIVLFSLLGVFLLGYSAGTEHTLRGHRKAMDP